MNAHCKIGKVTLKGGCHLVVLPSPYEARRKEMDARISDALSAHGTDLAGFALVVWDETGGSTTASYSGGGIPSILVPDFCRARLLAHRIESWTIETVNKQWGG